MLDEPEFYTLLHLFSSCSPYLLTFTTQVYYTQLANCKHICYNSNMEHDFRSDCPINFALEIFGDKWSLLIVRDIIFSGKCTYNEFLDSKEKIATNILASRLKKLEEMGIIQKHHDPTRKTKTKVVYLLTPMGIDLTPLFVETLLWGGRYLPGQTSAQPLIEKAQRHKSAFIKELRQQAEQARPAINALVD
jgi:DNA-binding HxlR family transcriptional regulator